MTSRERFLRTMAGLPVDRPPLWDEGIREDVREAWATQGVSLERDLAAEFSVDHHETVHPDIEHRRFWLVKRDGSDASEREAGDPRRYPEDWPERVRAYRARDYPVGVRISRGLFLTLGVGDWETLTPVLFALADEPDRVKRLMDEAATFALAVLDRAFSEVEFDYVLLSEPIASNAAPVIGPHSFRRVCDSAYRRLIAHAHARGVRWVIFQSYGHTMPLLPEAIRMGCNVYWGGDVALGHMSYLELRRRFGDALGLIGGIDANVLLQEIPLMEAELRRIVPPLVRSGRYLPLLDGRVRAHVPFAHYAAYRTILVRLVEEAARNAGG